MRIKQIDLTSSNAANNVFAEAYCYARCCATLSLKRLGEARIQPELVNSDGAAASDNGGPVYGPSHGNRSAMLR